MKSLILVLLVGAVTAQDDIEFSGPKFNFRCPEPNGKFRDPEQCDLYYVCEDGEFEALLCDDGLLFDDAKTNYETCKLPHDVDCGDRAFVQEPQKGIDPRCPRANGFFDHEDPAVCNKFYSCDKGVAFEMPCVASLVFDVKLGTCVRPEQLSSEGKICEEDTAPKVIDGFSCPGAPEVGSQGLLNQHPLYPHPTDCQFFFTCFYGKEPNKLGCPKGQVYDAENYVCKTPEEVAECSCWYDCGENSRCPDSCNADCSCPSGGES